MLDNKNDESQKIITEIIQEIKIRFDELDDKLETINDNLEDIDCRLENVENKFEELDVSLTDIDESLNFVHSHCKSIFGAVYETENLVKVITPVILKTQKKNQKI